MAVTQETTLGLGSRRNRRELLGDTAVCTRVQTHAQTRARACVGRLPRKALVETNSNEHQQVDTHALAMPPAVAMRVSNSRPATG